MCHPFLLSTVSFSLFSSASKETNKTHFVMTFSVESRLDDVCYVWWIFPVKNCLYRREQWGVTVDNMACGPISASSLPFRPACISAWLVIHVLLILAIQFLFKPTHITQLLSILLNILKLWKYISISSIFLLQKRHWRKKEINSWLSFKCSFSSS